VTRAFLLRSAITRRLPDSCQNVDRRGRLSPFWRGRSFLYLPACVADGRVGAAW